MNTRGICSVHTLGDDILHLGFSLKFLNKATALVWCDQDLSSFPEIKIKISYCPCKFVFFKIMIQDMHETVEFDSRQIGMK